MVPEESNRATSVMTEPEEDKKATVLETYGFTIGKTIGYGSYATVKCAYSQRHQCKVAIKVISKRRAPRDYLEKFLPREIEVVKILKHPNLICFLQSIETTNRVYFIMEYASSGDLLDKIKRSGYIQEPQAAVWFSQIINGLSYCHRKGIVHRDLKCENILVDEKNIVKITDFGFARGGMRPPDGRVILSQTYCGSYAYAPPEILTGTPYDPHLADIWSSGVVLFTMIFGKLPFNDTDHKALLKQVHSDVVFPATIKTSKAVQSLITRILTNTKKRIIIKDIKEDAWLKEHVEQPPPQAENSVQTVC